MATNTPTRSHKMRRWRLGVLLVIQALALAAYVHSQLFPPPPIEETSPEAKRLVAAVRALGGTAHLMQGSHRTFGFLRRPKLFSVDLGTTSIDDEAFGRFMAHHGDRLWSLDLRQTSISNDGLRHLVRASHLGQLVLGNGDSFSQSPFPLPQSTITLPRSPITDAGLTHLKGIPDLWMLSLNDIPITDAGLITLQKMPRLHVLSLTGTKVKGPGLSVLKSMPQIASLTLDGGAIDDQSLSYLAGATNLELLELRFLSLSGGGLKHLKTLPKLRELSLYRCGLLDEEVTDFRDSMPNLKVETPE